jgi:hypothetical protein
MSNVLKMLSRGGAVTAETDPNFNQTVLLLHGDGTNGAQNNTFLDGSTNNFTITRAGNTTQGTFSPFSLPDGYWSSFFDGTNDRLTIADNAVLRPGTGNFTIEAWVYRAAAGAAHTIFAKGASTPTGFVFGITSSDTLRFTNTSSNIDSTGTVAANTWVHVAVVREGTGANQLKLYINGVQDGQGTVSTDFNQTEEARIGENRGATDDFNGYISNFRYVVGSAIYTAGFTPSTLPLTTTSQGAVSSEVELLTCQSNRFVDNSTNGFTVTPVNNTRVTPFSPFSPTAAYSAGTNGGSGYFDGTGDYLSIADDAALRFGTGNFTIQCWIYRNVAGVTHTIASKGQAGVSGWNFTVNSTNVLLFVDTTTNIATTATIPAGSWTHVAVVREGTGTNQLKLYINGVESASATVSTDFNQTQKLNIGADRANSSVMNGYIAGFKYVVGTAETITVPTAPPTGGTALLNFTNAGIFDNTGKNNLETVGNAQVDTTTKKFGTGSMKFDGTGDYVESAAGSQDFNFGTGDFTIEFWLYANATTNGVAGFGSTGTITSGSNLQHDIVFVSNALRFRVMTGGTIITVASPSVSTSTWTHFALVRSGSTFTVYKDGVSQGTGSTSGALNFNTAWVYRIGTNVGNAVLTNTFNGYIDDFRITKGVARYTADFTPPTKELPNQ